VLTPLFCITAAVAALAALYYLAAAGLRDGDRPGDTLVTALVKIGTHPADARPRIVATVRNPSEVPVLAALSARRDLTPAWLADPHEVSVPLRTLRPKFRAGRYGCVGVVAAGGMAELAVPVPVGARRYVLTVAVGQQGGRLRVHRLRLGLVNYTAEGRDERFSSVSQP
jgi:hypothetical protein